MEFKDRVKTLRQDKNISLTNLGALIGKTESACRAWELGRSKPDVDTLIKLAEYFNCTTDYLLGLSNFKNEEDKTIIDGYVQGLVELLTATADEFDRKRIVRVMETVITGFAVSIETFLMYDIYERTMLDVSAGMNGLSRFAKFILSSDINGLNRANKGLILEITKIRYELLFFMQKAINRADIRTWDGLVNEQPIIDSVRNWDASVFQKLDSLIQRYSKAPPPEE